MAISEQRDPKTRKNYLLAEGIVEGVFFNELKNIKTYAGQDGKSWTPTHSINIVVDGTRISLGLTDKDKIRAKDVDGEYQDVVKGVEVSVVIEENGEYKGVTQYQGRTSGITVLDVSGAQQPQQSSGGGKQQSFQKKDMSGVHTGHAINVAINVVGGLDDPGKIINYAKKAHDLTTSLKKEYAEKNPSLSDYDVGAMVGQSVLSASHYADTVAEIEPLARQTLDEIVPVVSEYVKDGEKGSKVEKKAPAKKTTKTTKKQVTEAPMEDDEIPEDAYEDQYSDDIPF